ncbi:polysaccharide pyruvyl transferase CsaB [Anoxybacillus vitaminiphilus]|uniref:Polysaccharide pyruvyl transferase CsaB n=1 Tax=Paranoxybacillus vitaminiphilus TaxID=581036 RepID=A0A327YGB5_9BACL|nr:polysaccharide pyruvyl transferase family protein [Anoxybacillus vitaminiphilus]RAK19903.1 polysaccharide pyruvyl transferase CsaB [Anoxybacillus vitaminiphilus]
MKVGIIGNYGNNNGDEAILTGILKQLTEELTVHKEDIVIFSNHPENTWQRYGIKSVRLLHKKGNIASSIIATLRASYPIMKNLDLLIIGGGGLLMDMYKRDAPLYATLGILGHYAGCKVVVYGVGAGPIRTKIGAFFIKQLLKKAEQISVRDADSKALLTSLGIKKNIHIIGDPALFLSSSHQKELSSSIQKIAVTAVPYYSRRYWPTPDDMKYLDYISGMARNLDRLIQEKGASVTFFSTKYPQDVEVTKDIVSLMKYKDYTKMIDSNLHPDEIISICASHDLVIGTRLHSLILSIVAQTPVIGIGYHSKVQHFLSTIGQLECYIEMEKLLKNTDAIPAVVRQMESQWHQVQNEIQQISYQMKQEAAKGIELLNMTGEGKCQLKKS